MRWAERKRHEFILDHIQEHAEINRSDIMREFGVSVAQASIDLRKFQVSLPGALVYDKTSKKYVAPAYRTKETTHD